ncbi:MAG: leucine-rich repeat protein [Clostridia bacterium]|nr:leucine-rich repeat protein [Clostridia bacterium]
MKKRLLLVVSMVALLVLILAFSVNAENVINGKTTDEYSDLTIIEGVAKPTIINENARAVLAVNGTYYTVPTYYLIQDNTQFTWSINSNVKTALGLGDNVLSNLVRIEIPEGIKTSVESSNGGAKFERYKSLVEASLPTTLELMGEFFFSECTNLTTITGLKNTKISKIYQNTFYSCSSLTGNIELPNTVTEISANAFRSSAISSITIPDAVTTFGDHAFASCSSLTTINFSENSKLKTLNGNYHFEKTGLTSFYFPSGLTTLGTEGMFYNCFSLSSIENFENLKITTVPYRSFEGCPITSLTIPSSVTYIGKNAFKGNNITQDKLVIPNGVTTLYECSFAGSRQTINTIVLPESLTTFGGTYCFEYFYAKNFYIPAGLGAFGECTFNGLTTSGVAFFFTGTQDQAEALKSKTSTNKNSAFTGATIVSLEEYNNATDKTTKNYIVYGVNHCDAFYNGEHAFGETLSASFADGKFISDCSIIGTCSRAQCAKEETKETLAPLFSFLGFSKQENLGDAVLQSFSVNYSLFEKYEGVCGKISFGLLAGVDKLNSTDETEQARFNGVLYADGSFKDKVASVDFTKRNYDIFEMKLNGLSSHENASVYLCAYVLLNGEITYLHNNSASDTAVSFTYNSLGN